MQRSGLEQQTEENPTHLLNATKRLIKFDKSSPDKYSLI